MKKFFFGWTNIKWVIKEAVKMYSAKPSFFSKKRIESGIAFVIAQAGMIYFLLQNHTRFSMTDFIAWAAVEFLVAGYMVYQIQREKKTEDIQESEAQ